MTTPTTTTAVSRTIPAARRESRGADVTITMLGGFAVTVGDDEVDQSQWRRRQAAALVKLLGLTRGRAMHREQLMDSLWPDLTVDEAAPRLHKAAHFARRTLRDPGSLVLTGDVVALFPGRTVQVDAAHFESLANSAVSAADPAAARWAVAQYHGSLLPQDRYETWALDARTRLDLLYLRVLRVSERWDLIVDIDPTDEQAHLAIITELKQRGDHRSAMHQFKRLEQALRTELGVGPSPQAVRLQAQLSRDVTSPPLRSAVDDLHPGRGVDSTPPQGGAQGFGAAADVLSATAAGIRGVGDHRRSQRRPGEVGPATCRRLRMKRR